VGQGVGFVPPGEVAQLVGGWPVAPAEREVVGPPDGKPAQPVGVEPAAPTGVVPVEVLVETVGPQSLTPLRDEVRRGWCTGKRRVPTGRMSKG
jgi:hypothetical protein